jgi:hypothetical protein
MAAEPIPDKSGYSGFLLFGPGYLDAESNTVAGNSVMKIGNPTVDSVFSSPQSSDDVHPVLTGEVRYTIAEKRTQFFFGNSIEDLVQLDITQRIGARRESREAGTFGLFYVFNGIPPEVWEDPYLAGSPRRETDHNSQGARFEWDGILGSRFDLELTYRDIDIDVERSGQALGLSAQDQSLLDRNGDQIAIVLEYTHIISPRHILQPQIGYRDSDYNGGAVANDSTFVQLTYIYQKDRWTLVTNALVGKTDYNEDNPIYGRRQDSDELLFGAILSYQLAGAKQGWTVNGLLTYVDTDSDIDFHDNRVVSTIIALGYRF